MTAHLDGNGPLWAEPAEIAEGIVMGLDKQRSVIYLPGFWRLIMLIICAIPEALFKRLKL